LVPDKKGLRINERIRAQKVRLIDHENNQVGIVEKYEAMSMAREAGLDLVEVAPTSEPPVCRIMDYGKYLYQQKRKIRESHKKHQVHATTLKEIRLRPETDLHDLQIKVNQGSGGADKAVFLEILLVVFLCAVEILGGKDLSGNGSGKLARSFELCLRIEGGLVLRIIIIKNR